MSRIKKFVKIFLGIPLTVVAFFFIGKIFFDSWSDIQPHLNSANFSLIFFGVIFMLLFFLVRSITWVKLLNFFSDDKKPIFDSIYLYSAAETKRYIPGNIFSFISRIQKFKTEKTNSRTIIKAIGLEAIIITATATLASVIALNHFYNLTNYLFLFLLMPIGILLFYKIPQIRNTATKFFPRRSISEYIDVFLLSLLAWSFFGLANFFFAVSIFPNDPNHALLFSSIFTLAWLVGYLSFVAPMGLGVREAATIYLLAPFFPTFAGAAIAIFSRILFVLSEVLFLALSYVVYKNKRLANEVVRLSPILIISLASIFYTVYFTFVSISRHLKFYSGKFDLGNMENTLWNTVNGNFFIFSNPDGTNELSRLSAHADFILLLFAPFYAIYPSVNWLLVTQTAVLAIGAYFVYLISKTVIKNNPISVLLAIGYLTNFFVQEQNIFDFHSVSMATTFLLGAFYFLIMKKRLNMIIFLVLAVLTKENVYLVTFLIGGFLFFRKEKTLGLIVSLVSISLFLFLMTIAIPNARGGAHFALDYLSYLGDSTFEILLSPILKPEVFFSQLFRSETFEYIKTSLSSVGYLSLLSPLYLIFLMPDFLINVMSSNPNLRSIQYHYGALLVPFIYISAIYGIKWLLSRFKKLKTWIFYYLLFFIIYSGYIYSPIPSTNNSDTAAFNTIENGKVIHEELSKIPSSKSVTATNNVAAHLVQREKIYVIPNGIDEVDYLVFYKTQLDLAREIMTFHNEYITIFDSYDLVILKKINLPERAYRP